jgi:hypothetical protein
MFRQAAKIIEKFGGAAALGRQIGRHRSTVHRWALPREQGGTDGLIPSHIMPAILTAADLNGITLTPEDLAP